MDSNKKALSVLSASLLALVPWMQISKAVSADVSVSLASLGAVVACGGVIHLAYLAFNMTAVRVLGIGGKDKDACESPSPVWPALAAPHLFSRTCTQQGSRCPGTAPSGGLFVQ